MNKFTFSVFSILFFASAAQAATWNMPNYSLAIESDKPTPSFERRQFYLKDAPIGIGAQSAWSIAGGTGQFVKIIDIETCAVENHEDFNPAFYIGNNPVATCGDHGNHATAVWGTIAAKRDDKGVTGIAHGANYGFYGFIEGDLYFVDDAYILGINTAIQGAIDHLSAGDVMVIEQHMIGPASYTAVEYWEPIFKKLKEATDKGIICVEAAGNGYSNLDSAVYNGAFDLNVRDSGCILVGAASADDKERLGFSNYGSRIDAFGYGESVTTTGYGNLFSGGPTRAYTDSFSGTSSATPIVAGAVAVVSSIAKSQGRTLTPAEIRTALRATGTPQGPLTQTNRIGNLPDIKEMLKFLGI